MVGRKGGSITLATIHLFLRRQGRSLNRGVLEHKGARVLTTYGQDCRLRADPMGLIKLKQEPMSRSMQLHFISVTAFL